MLTMAFLFIVRKVKWCDRVAVPRMTSQRNRRRAMLRTKMEGRQRVRREMPHDWITVPGMTFPNHRRQAMLRRKMNGHHRVRMIMPHDRVIVPGMT
jgi:hypothetical protein